MSTVTLVFYFTTEISLASLHREIIKNYTIFKINNKEHFSVTTKSKLNPIRYCNFVEATILYPTAV